MSEEKNRDDWACCLSLEQQIELYAWSRKPIHDGSGNPPQFPPYELAKEYIARNYKAAIPSLEEWVAFIARYDVMFNIPAGLKICENPNCRKVFTPRDARQHFCTKKCGRKFRRGVYDAAYRAKHKTDLNKNELRALKYFGRLRYEESLESDPVKYAHHLELKRRSNHRCWEKKHPGCRPYKPMLSRRIPDWAVKGQVVVDRGSVFLSGNMSDEQVMAANDFALQQNAGEERHHPKIKTVFRK